MNRKMRASLALLAVLALGACFNESSCFSQTSTVLGPTQSQGGSNPSPSPSPTGVPGAFNRVVLEIFGRSAGCPAGETAMNPGCVIDMTATPKQDNTKVGPEIHGSSCAWFLNGVEVTDVLENSAVKVVKSQSQPFNVTLTGKAAGTFTITAKVGTVQSDAKSFTVSGGS